VTRPAGRACRGEAGFVLIGVVIFVLALTIIGISLYSLSSYEAQFLQRSIDSEQAFQSAVGGIERAKFALAKTGILDSVCVSLPAGVDTTMAFQDGQTTGAVSWDPAKKVALHVVANVNGMRRVMDAEFTPIDTVVVSYYSSLVTVRDGITVMDQAPGSPTNRDRTVLLSGTIWDGSGLPPSGWVPHVYPPPPDDILTSPGVPLPDVGPFLDRPGKIDLATPVTATGMPADPINLTTPPNTPAYFVSENQDAQGNFSFSSYGRNYCEIQVSGIAVWLLPQGGMFYQDTYVRGNPATDCLVIIAGPKIGSCGWTTAFEPSSSICFLGFLEAQIPIVLVSSGEVLMYHENNYQRNTLTTDVAIFARSARFLGPDPAEGVQLRLFRQPSGPLNSFIIDRLSSCEALPNAPRGGRRLDLVPGTWHASDR
jgi:hypothetical protein